MLLPGSIITWLTFPGVMVHELAHQLFCKWTGTRVFEVCYLRLATPAAYIVHESPSSSWKYVLIGLGPLVINTALAFLLALSRAPLAGLGVFGAVMSAVVLWLAVSIAMHSFPSMSDAENIWRGIWRPSASGISRVLGTPLVMALFLGALGSMFWLDLVYGLVLCYWIPSALGLG